MIVFGSCAFDIKIILNKYTGGRVSYIYVLVIIYNKVKSYIFCMIKSKGCGHEYVNCRSSSEIVQLYYHSFSFILFQICERTNSLMNMNNFFITNVNNLFISN